VLDSIVNCSSSSGHVMFSLLFVIMYTYNGSLNRNLIFFYIYNCGNLYLWNALVEVHWYTYTIRRKQFAQTNFKSYVIWSMWGDRNSRKSV